MQTDLGTFIHGPSSLGGVIRWMARIIPGKGPWAKIMEKKDKKKLCMICGVVEVGSTSICKTCSEKIRQEAVGERDRIKSEAEREIKKQGVPPKD